MTTARGPSRFRPSTWDLGLALGLWMLFMILMALGTFLVSDGGDSSHPRMILGALPAQFLAIVFIPILLRIRTRNAREELGLYVPAGPCLLRGLLDYLWVGPIWWIFALGWMFMIQRMNPEHTPNQEVMQMLQSLLSGTDALGIKLAALFVTTLGAAASEELLFRGLLHGALRRRMGKQLGALTLGAFFGLVHAQPSWIDSAFVVPPLAFLGYLLSLVRERPGGLWACILIHAANNSVAILLKLQPWN